MSHKAIDESKNIVSLGQESLFDEIRWRDPVTGRALVPVISSRTPSGVPLSGALRIEGTRIGYPIVDSVARLTVESANRFCEWLLPLGLSPPRGTAGEEIDLQTEDTVASFGFQWAWSSDLRSEDDLRWRIAERFRLSPADFADRFVVDAGAGAGNQSSWLLAHGARVLSIDLSEAIDVVARRLRNHRKWFGVQGDITAMPIESGQVDIAYCEGVLQHTRDSERAVRELCRVTASSGRVLATHYELPSRLRGRLRHAVVTRVRSRISRLEREKLLLLTGNLAALSYVPGLGKVITRIGLATRSDIMPSFRVTWTNTFDTFGRHAYQRHIGPADLLQYFGGCRDCVVEFRDGTVVRVQVFGDSR